MSASAAGRARSAAWSPGDVVAVLDLRTARPGERLFQLTPEQVRVPFGVEVVQVTPPTVAMAFEPSATRQVPVVPAVDGRPAPGFVVGRMTADPRAVEVVGPESAVKRATEALTEPVSVAGARERGAGNGHRRLLDPSLRLKTRRGRRSVTVQIVPAPLERTLRDRPVHLRNLGADSDGAGACRRRSTSTLRGSREALDRVGADDVVGVRRSRRARRRRVLADGARRRARATPA